MKEKIINRKELSVCIYDKFVDKIKEKGEEIVKVLNKKNESVDFSYNILYDVYKTRIWFVLNYKNVSIYGSKCEVVKIVKEGKEQEFYFFSDEDCLNKFLDKIQEETKSIDKEYVIKKIGIY